MKWDREGRPTVRRIRREDDAGSGGVSAQLGQVPLLQILLRHHTLGRPHRCRARRRAGSFTGELVCRRCKAGSAPWARRARGIKAPRPVILPTRAKMQN